MAGDQDGAPVRQDVVPGGDAHVAGRDVVVNVSPGAAVGGVDARGAQGVQVGGGVQVNVFGRGGADVVPGSAEEFRADLLALAGRVEEDAVRRGLPERLVPGGDVLRMTRAVRLLGEVRQPSGPDGQGPEAGPLDRDLERAYAPAAERGDRGGEPPRPWEQVAAAHERLVVLGDPGMGKSWLLRQEAHRLAVAARRDLAAGGSGEVAVPVVIRAGALAGLPGRTLAEAVSGYLVGEGWLPARSAARMRALIDGGGVVLLVDALDEVPARGGGPGSLQRVAGLLRRWAESCTVTARCVVTSRLAGYAGPPVPGAREAELLPFGLQDMQVAVQAWELPAEAAAQLRGWLARPAVVAMARVPLLLALLCSLAADPSRRGPLPRTRTELYGAVVWQFLSSGHRSGGPGGTGEAVGEADRHALLAALTQVAFTFASTSQGWVDQMPYRDLVGALRGAGGEPGGPGEPAEVVLDRLVARAGVLVPAGSPAVGEQDYLFLHRTIAEYLLARHLAALPAGDRMRAVMAHQWFDPDWAEVIPMLGALLAPRNLPDAQALVGYFLTARPDPFHRAFDIGLRMICEAPDPDRLLTPATSKALHHRLPRLVRSRSSSDRLTRTLTTAPAWPRAITSEILALAASRDARHRLLAARVLGGRAGGEVTGALLILATDTQGIVRQAAAWALRDREGTEFTSALLTRVTSADSSVRQTAERALGDRAEARSAYGLFTLATSTDSSVREAAARVLGSRAGGEVTGALLVLATDADTSVREAAARALRGRAGGEVTGALLTLATDTDAGVRETTALALGDRAGAEVTSALLALATSTDSSVREAAARVLGSRAGAEVTGALLVLATDADTRVRWAAAEALGGRAGAEVTSALLALATDTDRRVRWAAAKSLTGRRDPLILDQLCRRRRVFERPALRRERRDLADEVADYLYVLLPAEARPRIFRRLGRLARNW